MAHGGNPAPPNNPGIDGTGLTLTPIPPGLPDTWVIPVNSDIDVAMEFTLSGSIASALVGTPAFNYKVTYTFAGLGVAAVVLASSPLPTFAGQLVYGAPNTTLTVVQGGSTPKLPVGTYEVLATVSFAPAFPFVAFFELPVLEIFTP